jgi:Raf kinase inhibitor-like YbhB/YbcL family protein
MVVVTAALCLAAQAATITLTSSGFKNNAPIPLTYTGYGDYKSPPLAWSGLPKGTRELALIVDDPDVPMERFATHWLLYNIPGTARGLPADLPATATLDAPGLKGATQGPNALKRLGYLPPKPFADSGVHHYTFTLYALDADLPLAAGLSKAELLAAMKGHVIGEGKLVGLFERKNP